MQGYDDGSTRDEMQAQEAIAGMSDEELKRKIERGEVRAFLMVDEDGNHVIALWFRDTDGDV